MPDTAGGRISKAKAYTNIALCRLNLDEIRAGLVAIEKAEQLAGEVSDTQSALSRVLIENNYTRLLLEADNFDGAK